MLLQIVKNGMGRSIGEAFAEFVSLTESDRGMTKFGQKIGKRFVFHSGMQNTAQ